jgi:phosphoribosylformylglycinamidine synthase subunit PurQ / glutaminase
MSTPPKFCVLKAPGINCEVESALAVEQAGGEAEIVYAGQLLPDGDRNLSNYQGLFIPGGFSYADAVRAGVVLARELEQQGMGDDIRTFVDQGKPVLGICNGFQVLVAMGLLPGEEDANGKPKQTASLVKNDSGRFESRWVNLKVNPDVLLSPFVTRDLPDQISLPIANGEGKFVASDATLEDLRSFGQVLMYYCDLDGNPSMAPADNPSGSMDAIAAIGNQHGNVMGSMPHIERFVIPQHNPSHRRSETSPVPYGLLVMRNIVDYAGKV